AFVVASWNQIVADNWVANYQAYVTANVPNPNAFTQYLMIAVPAQRAGVAAIQAFTANGVAEIFGIQATSSANANCLGFSQTYGGWYHNVSSSDCGQKMGYHYLVTAGLLRLWEFLLDASACNSSTWQSTCAKMPTNIAAALAWIFNVQDP